MKMPLSTLVPVVVLAAIIFLGTVCFQTSASSGATRNCSGRKVLNGDEGLISDGSKNYLANSHCEWLIEAGSPNKTIHLYFKSMSTECSFDFLFIYDGNSYTSPLLATLSGDSMPHPVTARSGYMLLYLYSDRNYLKEGFDARYFIYDCPWNCSNHGTCVNHTCHCQSDHYGDGCQHRGCVDNCNGHGTCVPVSLSQKRCECEEGYAGHACNVSLADGVGQAEWYTLQPSGSGFKGRTSHTAVFLEEADCLWVFGGFDLNLVLNDLSHYCFHTNRWEGVPVSESQPWPLPRSGHAMAGHGEGFFVFGGVLANGSHSNELWYFNTTSETWAVKGRNGSVSPLPVTGHTLTAVDQWLYLIGGKTEDRVSRDSVYRIDATNAESWEVVVIKGSRYPPKRLVGHSTVYHRESNALIVFGGYIQSSALFSDRSRRIYSLSLQDNYWTELINSNWEESKIPKERAFHSAVLIGNYMVVYGGNTHDHSGLEICYNARMYFYHLGCHVWLNHTYFTGPLTAKGRFGHQAAVARGNLMLIVGGYSGQVLDDLMVYKVPSAVAPYPTVVSNDSDHCQLYGDMRLCIDDPECVFCKEGIQLSSPRSRCVHRSHSQLCKGEPQDTPDRCPGICHALHTCGACVSHGRGANLTDVSPRRQVHISQCSWCVKEAKCQTRSAPVGTCKVANQTRSGNVGWWGGLSKNLTTILQCQRDDFPAGLHWIKYRNPMNLSFPDELSIKRSTSGTLGYVSTHKIESDFTYTARFIGFLHPLNATPPPGNQLHLYLGLSNAQARLYLSDDETEESKEKVISIGKLSSFNTSTAHRKREGALFPDVSRGHKYYLAQVTEQVQRQMYPSKDSSGHSSEVKISWNGFLNSSTNNLRFQVITSEFLEPYSNGHCDQHYNCLGCLTDTLCSWCQVTRTCVLRNDTNITCVANRTEGVEGENSEDWIPDEEYYITSASECPNCGNHVQCHTCADDPLCEWVAKNGHCTRRYRIQDAVRNVSDCRPPCHHRQDCSECIAETGQCVWCENTQTCLPFSDYVTRYIYGQCTSWVDTITMGHGCHNCSVNTDCNTCLSSFGCGWCGNDDNPNLGVCVDGDFTGPRHELTCAATVEETFPNLANESASWSYDRCPDVEECRLGLHKCHPNATCLNTFDGYECHCNQGYKGDGQDHCEKTCFYNCVHGRCSGPLDYVCLCELGWTNPWCNESCNCNNHSTCSKGVGICDECQHHTSGPHCQHCSSGSYGNPSDPEGCRPCDCNGHGDLTEGECNNITGECFCTHDTRGLHCDLCEEGYYGLPRNGGKCYLQCDDRSIHMNITEGGVGSYRGGGVRDPSHAYCLWILSVFHEKSLGVPYSDVTRIISLTVEGDMQVECGQDAIQVYDGIPAHINGTSHSRARHLGSVCGINPGREFTVHAYSGTITIVFEANLLMSQTRGFNATYKTDACRGCGSDDDWNLKCMGGNCQCETGFYGADCQREMCPHNCFAHRGQGSCDKIHGMCRCQANFAGSDCSINIGANPHVELLVDKSRLDDKVSAPSARVGHTMVSCGDHKLYLFGGYNLQRGLLNDTWRYDTLSGQWDQLEPRGEDRPMGRYYQAAACAPGRLEIFIYGGFLEPVLPKIMVGEAKKTTPQPTNELWAFNMESNVWQKRKTPPWMPALVGHTLTYVGDKKLVLIGGFSSQIYFSNKVYEYNTDGGLLSWQEFSPEKMNGAYPIGLYGHSAVYNQPSNTIYVYGGYLFRAGRWFVSRELYTYDVALREWNLLMIQAPDYPISDIHDADKEPMPWEGRVFHTAVGTESEMIIIGGLMDDGSYAMDLLVYRYNCNTWHRIQFAQFEVEQKTITAMGIQAVLDGGHIYMYGGFVGNMVGTLSRLTLPEDICAIFSHDECQKTLGCHICGNATAGVCFTAGKRRRRPLECAMQDSSESHKQCGAHWYIHQNCSRFKSCSQCLSKYPQFKSADQRCQWCTNCPKGACIPMKASCPSDKDCPLDQHIIQQLGTCFEYLCPASDCQMCSHLAKCLWTRHFKRSSEIGRYYNKDPVYNWNCVTRTLRPISATTFVGYPPGDCPKRCYQHTNCTSCLLSHGVEGGSQMCLWSETLGECLPPVYLPLRCSFGECGYIYNGGRADLCPVPCHQKKQCHHCITTPGCGWCALTDMNGQGVCMRGGLTGPSEGSCSQGNMKTDTGHAINHLGTNPEWKFDECLTENECKNGHHTCDKETQICVDTVTSFRCQCKPGYIKNSNGRCEPVCHQGCIKGTCVQPDVCQCFFGWVGDNCSVECECHKHSNCESVTRRDVCLRCENNTMGNRCEMCRRFFVGDPVKGTPCIPCREFCNNHTDVCVSRDENEVRMMGSQQHTLELRSRGPRRQEAMCLNCQHNTTGDKCGECTDGHFRKQGQPKTWGCTPCQCNGHSNKCNRDTGENCACQNNTDTKCEHTDGLQCWQLQCSICKEYFLGTPTNGHQCYRQMQVDLEYCLDPNSQTDCLHDPVALLAGRTVFYAVQPKYLNVDIRITIDITQGGADVYFSNREDMFQVFVDGRNGLHSVIVDPQYKVDINSRPPIDANARHRRSTSNDISAFGDYSFEHVRASSLNTYITVSQKNTILVVRNVQFRLVITLPEKDHNLRVSRFYIIVQSREDPTALDDLGRERVEDKTYGVLYFRQDQPHIDLFVFFSVFFSCFFLFLALCVMLWKVKQAFDARRSRQLREREMECMASRPFAKVLVLVEPEESGGGEEEFGGVGFDTFGFGFGGNGNSFMSTIYHRRGRLSRPMLRLHHHPMELSPAHAPPPRTHNLSVVPIAVEPTDDGIAAVGTVLFQLPGASQAPCHLCMGSTLTMRISPPQSAHKPTQRRRASSSPC